jgi:cytochrome P450
MPSANQKRVIAFDQHSAQYAADPWNTAASLARESPVAWTESHGGFWVISGFEEVREATRNAKTFSSRHDMPNGCSRFQGINIPSVDGRFLPIEIDPPEQLEWRRVLATQFSPQAAAKLHPMMQQCATWCIDQHIETGKMEMVMGLTSAVPAFVTLRLLGLPLSQWHKYVEITHKTNYTSGKERDGYFAVFAQILEEVATIALTRREKPQDDLLTLLATMTIGGRQLNLGEIASACGVIIAGGIDTTSAVVASALKFLAENPRVRERLISNPELMPGAVEEFVRHTSPVTGLARTVTTDVSLGGQQLRAGDRVLILYHGANMDHRAFNCPTELNIDRDAGSHVGFGFGAHRCLGSAIARVDVPILIAEVLKRIPDYELDGAPVRYPSIAVSNNYVALPVKFTPGTRVGIDPQLQAEISGSS